MFISGQDILIALGLMLFLEGMLYALLPRDMLHKLFRYLLAMPLQEFRLISIVVATIGVIIMWYVSSKS